MNKKIVIGIDVDGVIADFTGYWTREISKVAGSEMPKEALNQWDLGKVIEEHYKGKVDPQIAWDTLYREGFMRDIPFKGSAKMTFFGLCHIPEFEIKVITAVHPCHQHERVEWFKEHFPGLNYELIFAEDKAEHKVDWMIDDGLHNLDNMVKNGGMHPSRCICISEPFNEHSEYVRVDSLAAGVEIIVNSYKPKSVGAI